MLEPLSLKFAEDYPHERTDIAAVRQHSIELGVDPISASTGATIAQVVAASSAESIIEIGTGIGVSGLWMLTGSTSAVLTSIDTEAEHQQLAKRSFMDAGIAANRVRLINGRASEVLPRMNEGSYDLVFIDADPASILEYVEHGLRLARQGGTVIVAHALWRGRVADPTIRDDTVAGMRSLLSELATSEAVSSTLLPIGDGLLVLTKRES